MPGADLILAAAPILILVYWMTRRKPLPSAKALPYAAAAAYLVQRGWLDNNARLSNASVLA